MNDADWNPPQMPAMQIYRASRFLTRINDQRLRPTGLGVAHLPVFAALKDGSALSQKELARIAQVEQPTMAQMLARMDRDGLILRTPDPNDGRSSLISLTPKALEQLPTGRAILSQVNEETLAGFSDRERKTFSALLRRAMQNLEEMSGSVPD